MESLGFGGFVEVLEIEDFKKVQIQVGLVFECSRVTGSEKLLNLQVDFGNEKRQILTGLGFCYEPEHFLNKKFLFVTNLRPRKMMGLESNGMILGIGRDLSKKPVLVVPENPDAENGDFVC